eukprot:TRINITY_DN244_c0_g2_i4.p2 TRINITY_DN244_c0_g2~~TRINITY_DN244_c0_g2_i4.p2  ORF type:complete len:208 (+),score=-9.78 TRINITY_DN244_c0_g2_i4:1383-2006(+)
MDKASPNSIHTIIQQDILSGRDFNQYYSYYKHVPLQVQSSHIPQQAVSVCHIYMILFFRNFPKSNCFGGFFSLVQFNLYLAFYREMYLTCTQNIQEGQSRAVTLFVSQFYRLYTRYMTETTSQITTNGVRTISHRYFLLVLLQVLYCMLFKICMLLQKFSLHRHLPHVILCPYEKEYFQRKLSSLYYTLSYRLRVTGCLEHLCQETF